MATEQITVQNKKNKKEKVKTEKVHKLELLKEPSVEFMEVAKQLVFQVGNAIKLKTSLDETLSKLLKIGQEEGLSEKQIRKVINELAEDQGINRRTLLNHLPKALKYEPRGDPGGQKKVKEEQVNSEVRENFSQTDINTTVTNDKNIGQQATKEELLAINLQEGEPVVDVTKSYADSKLNKKANGIQKEQQSVTVQEVEQEPAAAVAVQEEQQQPDHATYTVEQEFKKLQERNKLLEEEIVMLYDKLKIKDKELQDMNNMFNNVINENSELKAHFKVCVLCTGKITLGVVCIGDKWACKKHKDQLQETTEAMDMVNNTITKKQKQSKKKKGGVTRIMNISNLEQVNIEADALNEQVKEQYKTALQSHWSLTAVKYNVDSKIEDISEYSKKKVDNK